MGWVGREIHEGFFVIVVAVFSYVFFVFFGSNFFIATAVENGSEDFKFNSKQAGV